ncbi:zinc-ribbon-domain-containing protein, partial [Diplogelasinospora grovesii]
MPSLAEVSNFIIQPVLRQARRFSSGFATEEPAPVNVTGLQHQRTRSASASAENAILEGTEEEDRIISIPDRTIARTDLRLPDRTATGAIAHEQYAREHATATTTLQMQATQILDRMRNTPDRSTTIPNPPQPLPTQNATVTPANEADTAAAVLPLWADDTKKSTLPEDDGMGQLRRRILAVQSMDISQGLKAQLMHQMLIEGYMKSQLAASQGKLDLRPESPTSQMMRTEEHAQEPSGPLQALKFWSPSSDGTSAPLDLPLSEEDLKPTYCPPQASPDDVSERMENMEVVENGQRFLGCEHYRRNVKLQCATCERWYTCRFCHDAAEDHVLPRKDTKNMLCMLCGAAQRASDTCIRCGESAAYYFCGVCKLWNDDPNKSIYHCSDCGLCRVGQGLGKDFFHCKKCMACISMTGPHKCIERSTDCDCPICGDYMFNSPKPVVFMQCGHSIHRHCFNEHMKSSYKCPLCSKSCVNMEYQFRNYDVAILTQPMPVEYRDARAVISCNDCSAKSQTAYHWLGLKCTVCNSYNTVQLQLLHMP